MAEKKCNNIEQCPNCGSLHADPRNRTAEFGFQGGKPGSQEMQIFISYRMTCMECGCQFMAEVQGVGSYTQTYWQDEQEKEEQEDEIAAMRRAIGESFGKLGIVGGVDFTDDEGNVMDHIDSIPPAEKDNTGA